MNCLRCNSHRIMKFVDGHGQNRVFCKNCGRSFLDNNHIKEVPHRNQKNILGFDVGMYHRPGVIQFR